MDDTMFLEVPHLLDKNGVQVKNNDILRIECVDNPNKNRFVQVGFGVYVDDNMLEQHIGFYAMCDNYKVTLGQVVGHSNSFKVVGNRMNFKKGAKHGFDNG